MYKINQKVLVRKKTPKIWYVCIGKIEKVVKYDMYKVRYRDLVNNQKVSSWFFVEDIADLQVQRGSIKKKCWKKSSQKTRRNG